MRRGITAIVTILIGIFLLMSILWFYGYHSDTTSTLNSVENLKRRQHEILHIVAQRFPEYIRQCREIYTHEQDLRSCVVQRSRQDLDELLRYNIRQ